MSVCCNGKYNMRSHLDELRLGSLFNNCFVRSKFILETDRAVPSKFKAVFQTLKEALLAIKNKMIYAYIAMR